MKVARNEKYAICNQTSQYKCNYNNSYSFLAQLSVIMHTKFTTN